MDTNKEETFCGETQEEGYGLGKNSVYTKMERTTTIIIHLLILNSILHIQS